MFQDIWDYAEISGGIVIVTKFQLSYQLVVIFVFFLLREYQSHEKAYLSFLLLSQLSSSLDESAIFTQPRTNVTDLISNQGNFSSYAGKDQRRRWSVHTF